MDECFEAINLVQTNRIEKFPVILFNREYWKGMVDWLKTKVVKEGCINDSELGIFTIADSPKEVVAVIKKFYAKA
ncbi:MAG: LOG family protein [Candidatus Omnitrophica bacterium]|nr:LOG family protein [Candidatus Omnitrophota bacterium]